MNDVQIADSRLLTAHDYIVALDDGQFWLSSCLCPEEDYPLDDLPELAWDELGDLLQEATQGDGIAQIPVEFTFSGTLLVLSPHQNNFEMPLRVEVWEPAPDDIAEWPEAFETHLDVDPHRLKYGSTTMSTARLDVPPGTTRLSPDAGRRTRLARVGHPRRQLADPPVAVHRSPST